tara:strand:+ start:504 stop:1079 length:576 start_codon:yes stop_codon:yes gene_type:complete
MNDEEKTIYQLYIESDIPLGPTNSGQSNISVGEKCLLTVDLYSTIGQSGVVYEDGSTNIALPSIGEYKLSAYHPKGVWGQIIKNHPQNSPYTDEFKGYMEPASSITKSYSNVMVSLDLASEPAFNRGDVFLYMGKEDAPVASSGKYEQWGNMQKKSTFANPFSDYDTFLSDISPYVITDKIQISKASIKDI